MQLIPVYKNLIFLKDWTVQARWISRYRQTRQSGVMVKLWGSLSMSPTASMQSKQLVILQENRVEYQ